MNDSPMRALERDLASGAWRHRDMVGYTSRGIGACVIPFRAFCPGEAVLVTLKQGSDYVSEIT